MVDSICPDRSWSKESIGPRQKNIGADVLDRALPANERFCRVTFRGGAGGTLHPSVDTA